MKSHFGQQLNFVDNLIRPLIFIVGPTAIGKSALAIKLAEKLNGEIINADSMQVYLNLNILTARPSKNDQKLIPHHLYGYIDGSIRYNVASWCKDTNNIIITIVGDKKEILQDIKDLKIGKINELTIEEIFYEN